MNKPHKHAELIKAWADGATIQFLNLHFNEWKDILDNSPSWNENTQYRIKPEQNPDVIQYVDVHPYSTEYEASNTISNIVTLKITFCGETGKLKYAEVLV